MSNIRSEYPNVTSANNVVLKSKNSHRFTGKMPDKLHLNPVVLIVNADGERLYCPIDDKNINTNPFVCHQKESRSSYTSKEPIPKLIRKMNKSHKQKQRKIRDRAYQKSANVILTQLNNYTPKQQLLQKCAWTQTDQPSNTILDKELNLNLVNKKLKNTDKFLDKFMPENLQILTSFLIMIILIFWLTSVIVDCDVPADFWRISTSYIRSFKWNDYYKEPQTNAEKYFEYITNIFFSV